MAYRRIGAEHGRFCITVIPGYPTSFLELKILRLRTTFCWRRK